MRKASLAIALALMGTVSGAQAAQTACSTVFTVTEKHQPVIDKPVAVTLSLMLADDRASRVLLTTANAFNRFRTHCAARYQVQVTVGEQTRKRRFYGTSAAFAVNF